MFRKIFLISALAVITLTPARSQVIVDMSLVTCQQYLASDPARQEVIAAWMNGYFQASKNQPMVNLNKFDQNKKSIAAYCKKRKGETLMSAIQRTVR